MLQQSNGGIQSTEEALREPEVRELNTDNSWLEFLQTGKKRIPYLQAEGRLKKHRKNQRGVRVSPPISANQRRIVNG